jgi:PTH1 family peptidyl-tRNA hydrolase
VQLVLGLGNPGAGYARTRHNVGWRVVDILVDRWQAQADEGSPTFRAWRGERAGHQMALMVPLTYMNLSGQALSTWRERRGLEPEELLVVTDDVYLPIGMIRLRARGSSGGHRGLESVEAALGTSAYARLRIGVGEVEASGLREHVLEPPSENEEARLEESLQRAADAVEHWVAEGILATMNRFNRRIGKEVSEP